MAYAIFYYSIVLIYVLPKVLLPNEAVSIENIKNPIIWIVEFIFIKDAMHLKILVYWLMCMSFMFIVMSFSKEKTIEVSKTKKKDLIYLFGGRISVPKIIYRKFFHIMAVIMFVPVTIQRPLFMCLSYAVAICLFLLIESFRVQFITEHEVNSLARALHFYIKQFTDSRDSGTFILTHIYLLIGCMIPTCVEIFSHEKTINYHRILSGVMILGIGDTMASVVGFNFGKTKWNYPIDTKKSVEGTFASFLSVCFISYLVVPIHFTSNLELCSYIFCTLAASMLEAYTVQIDNLILPVFFYTLLCAFSTIQSHLFTIL
ncbi:predicted protein [Naegleria gruberi]|uniref:dolichol kinase n=1 Tax=Naegleria gruberi TaxID=5762 RepID=D2V4Q1_NAEGR|nr:uncharacterized protein NAEGRDRAFT_63868 [Naegleria gruberi]EFC47971.1 predicted protein [Naegleria gruberi]|eukprot:XP_002680715.1 predicted protein [Naegleria gruberi strain NEG-M]